MGWFGPAGDCGCCPPLCLCGMLGEYGGFLNTPTARLTISGLPATFSYTARRAGSGQWLWDYFELTGMNDANGTYIVEQLKEDDFCIDPLSNPVYNGTISYSELRDSYRSPTSDECNLTFNGSTTTARTVPFRIQWTGRSVLGSVGSGGIAIFYTFVRVEIPLGCGDDYGGANTAGITLRADTGFLSVDTCGFSGRPPDIGGDTFSLGTLQLDVLDI